MEGVQGDVFAAEEVAHFIESDPESAWLLAYRGDEAAGCGVGRPSSLAGSLYTMARVLPGHRRQGVGSRLYEALSDHARSLGLTSLWGRIAEKDAESFALRRAPGIQGGGT
jgi:GNAT superfamily N-acetyltransferase